MLAKIAPGDIVITRTIDASGRDEAGKVAGEASNPLTGPFFIEGAEIEPVVAVDAGYVRCILMFDGNDEVELQGAREQWRALKARGQNLSYWRQNDNGGWEKMAV